MDTFFPYLALFVLFYRENDAANMRHAHPVNPLDERRPQLPAWGDDHPNAALNGRNGYLDETMPMRPDQNVRHGPAPLRCLDHTGYQLAHGSTGLVGRRGGGGNCVSKMKDRSVNIQPALEWGWLSGVIRNCTNPLG